MELKHILIGCFIVLGLLNTYCFLFQRTARKIRQYAVGSSGYGLENKLLPDWYTWLNLLSTTRFIPLVWLLFIDWKIGVGLFLFIWVLNMIIPVNDHGNIQKIKKHFERKVINGTFDEKDEEYLAWVIKAEEKTL